jgi:acetyltransferase-like isoleucine patch superfamily enzyme
MFEQQLAAFLHWMRTKSHTNSPASAVHPSAATFLAEVRATGARVGEGTFCTLANIDGVAPELVTIGRNCLFAPGSAITTHDASLLPAHGAYVVRPTTVGNDVFIGFGALILPGVTVGDGAIIGAGAVVCHNVDAGTIVAGVPARPIGSVAARAARLRDELIVPPEPWSYVPTTDQLQAFRAYIDSRIFGGGTEPAEEHKSPSGD